MEALIDRAMVEELTTHFKALTSVVPLHPIHTEDDYDKAVTMLSQLLDIGAANERHPLSDLANALGTLIAEFDETHFPQEEVSPVEMVKLLMSQHGLSQSDLPEIGTQGVVSVVLGGKRALHVRQIKALAERFQVPAHVFL